MNHHGGAGNSWNTHIHPQHSYHIWTLNIEHIVVVFWKWFFFHIVCDFNFILNIWNIGTYKLICLSLELYFKWCPSSIQFFEEKKRFRLICSSCPEETSLNFVGFVIRTSNFELSGVVDLVIRHFMKCVETLFFFLVEKFSYNTFNGFICLTLWLLLDGPTPKAHTHDRNQWKNGFCWLRNNHRMST